ncbi:GtrA family protein [Blastococcus sp. MG754426]|uniref:GtrA family protein n=1 Tax=Blastococcus sp. MG754426 TaxID=2570317 RepID=UPI001F023F97|nr:GtrA family protein [Blastococcus sp. MG754426]
MATGIEVRPAPVAGWLRSDRTPAQFARFVLVGGSANLVYLGLFLLLAGLGDQAANLGGVVVSTAVANELHRRLTFRAADRAGWATAQWAGGGLALAGLATTSLALAAFEPWTASAGPMGAVAVVWTVTAVVGVARFVGLRWAVGGGADRARAVTAGC